MRRTADAENQRGARTLVVGMDLNTVGSVLYPALPNDDRSDPGSDNTHDADAAVDNGDENGIDGILFQ